MGINALCYRDASLVVEMKVRKESFGQRPDADVDIERVSPTLKWNSMKMANMRVAVAGSCGLAILIAQEIQESTSHQVVILSRFVGTQGCLYTLCGCLQAAASDLTCLPGISMSGC